ncbi:MAG: hypothetical protein GVY02_08860, partial [Bacteroidetes bacterium]|nr:hypothetical protein [Bacteroidota bacterium]
GEIQASLARVVIGGLTASTLITLVLIPVVYITANRIKQLIIEKRAEWAKTGEQVSAQPA